ncbi:MAG: TonB-dependent receptor [Proteobacteria bacterium]|nr:TonB-dependent receptor [Pseudomonadota bacterium]
MTPARPAPRVRRLTALALALALAPAPTTHAEPAAAGAGAPARHRAGAAAGAAGAASAAAPALEDIVLAAMTTPTTVQEAPAIVTVITSEQIHQQGFRYLADALGMVPGFLNHGWGYNVVATPLTRGILFGALYLQDGVDMYDPIGFVLLPAAFPVETLQRAEVTSGPGGVLWGSNSFVGVVNLVTKTADDLDGLETHVSYGGGPSGRRHETRLYVMGGTKLFAGKLKLFGHAAYRGWTEGGFGMPLRIVLGNLAAGPTIMEPNFTGASGYARQLDLTGNAQYGDLSLHWSVPFNRVAFPASPVGTAALERLDEDALDCADPRQAAACANRVDPDRTSRGTRYDFGNRLAVLRFRPRLWRERLALDARAFFVQYRIAYEPLASVLPSELLRGGVSIYESYVSSRSGLSLDAQAVLPGDIRLLAGGELFYDEMPANIARWRADPSLFAGGSLNGAPCPPATPDNLCPVVVHNASNRLTSGLFVSAERRLPGQLVLNAATRVQFYGGKRALDPVVLFSGAAVWAPTPALSLKTNFAEGFRPPSLLKTDSNSVGSWLGNPELKVERSRALQGEANVRLLADHGGIRSLSLRADYAYTWVSNFIQLNEGRFVNVASIGTHSAELLARINLKGGQSFALGYSFLDGASDDQGKLRSQPNQWLTLQALLPLIGQRFFLTSNLTVVGGFEDPNRRGASTTAIYLGRMANGLPVQSPVVTGGFTDQTIDSVGPTASWNAGLRYLLSDYGLRLAVDAYNLLDQRGFQPNGFLELASGLEPVPNPYRGVSVFGSVELAL